MLTENSQDVSSVPGSTKTILKVREKASEDFQQEGKQDFAKHLLYSLVRTGKSSGEHILRTMAGILSGPVALDS